MRTRALVCLLSGARTLVVLTLPCPALMLTVFPAVPSVHVSYDVQYTVAVPAGQARGRLRQAPWAPLWDARRPTN